MKATAFPEQNMVIAKDQPPYFPLPAYRGDDGVVTTCWSFTWRERLSVLFTGQLWWAILTFENPCRNCGFIDQRLQPQKPLVECPFERPVKWWQRLLQKLERVQVKVSRTRHTVDLA